MKNSVIHAEPSIKFEAISADHWKQKLTFEINVTWTKEIYSERLTKLLNGGMSVSTLSIVFERSNNIKIDNDTLTFKKWSNDPLSKNSVRIIMGQPKWQKGYYGSIPSPLQRKSSTCGVTNEPINTRSVFPAKES